MVVKLNNLILDKLCELIYEFYRITKININNKAVSYLLLNKYL